MEIVAEFTYNHSGKVSLAKKMILSAMKSGATCVKIELRNNAAYFRNNTEILRKRSAFEFNEYQLEEFVKCCRHYNINWFASVHDIHSLKKVLKFYPSYIKIASREARNTCFLRKVAEINNKQFPIVVSTGALSFGQVTGIYKLLRKEKLTLLHTSCLYPCSVGDLNINRILLMKRKFDCSIGYSGHEEGFVPSLYAVFLGIDYIERHFALDRIQVAKGKQSFHDELCTLRPNEFKEMVNGIRKILQLKNQAVNKGVSLKELKRVNAYGNLLWDGNDVFVK